MGIEIVCDEDAPVPRRTQLWLTCDAVMHSMFDPLKACFDEGNYMANCTAAKAVGWLEQSNGTWLCPGCSGKKAHQPAVTS
jgi:hypothetical protein